MCPTRIKLMGCLRKSYLVSDSPKCNVRYTEFLEFRNFKYFKIHKPAENICVVSLALLQRFQ